VNLKEIGLQGSQHLIEIQDLSKVEKLEKVNLCMLLIASAPSISSQACRFIFKCFFIESLTVHSKSLCVLKLNGCYALMELFVMSEETTQQILSSGELDLYKNVESMSSNMKTFQC